MEHFGCSLFILLCFVISNINFITLGSPLVPALCIFGDSVMDAGNNNYITTLIRANFLPYGRDFVNHQPTGRFCNGKLAVDYTAESLGFDSYPPPYLSPANDTLLTTGANFASAGSGFYDMTAHIYQAITLPEQVAYYREWQSQVVRIVGNERAHSIFSGGIHILSAGSSDFLQNYYINPLLRTLYTPSNFSDMLLRSYSNFVQDLYGLGARRIGVTTLPPIGCLPAAISLYGFGRSNCISRLNDDAVMFNKKLNVTSQQLIARFPDLKLVIFDIYQLLLNMVKHPSDQGFLESRRGCCGTGTVETSLLCNIISIGTCSNATGYVFWDGFHPSEAANRLLSQNLVRQGMALIS